MFNFIHPGNSGKLIIQKKAISLETEKKQTVQRSYFTYWCHTEI